MFLKKSSWPVFIIFVFLFFSSFSVFSADAAFSRILSYQGKLTNSAGAAVADGTYTLRARLYTASTGGSSIFDETLTATTTSGIFSVSIGEASSTASLNFNQPLYLGITINTDAEMTPRKKLSSAPAAYEADKLNGFSSDDFLKTNSAGTSSIPYASSTALTVSGNSYFGTTTMTNLSVTNPATSTFAGGIDLSEDVSL